MSDARLSQATHGPKPVSRTPIRMSDARVSLALVLGLLSVLGPTGARAQPAAPPAASAAPNAAKAKDDRTQPLTVDADRMERFGKESLVIFTGNVVGRQNNSVQYADRMEVYLDEKGDRVLRTISTGNIRIITRDCRTATAKRAEYFDLEQRVILTGNPRVWQDDNVVSGDTITIYLSQDRSIVQGGKQERVKAVFYPREDGKKDGPTRARPGECKN